MGRIRTRRKPRLRGFSVSLAVAFFACALFIITDLPDSLAAEGEPQSEITVRRSVTGVDVVVAIDQSGSMNGYAGFPASDPLGLRASASRYLIENLASKSKENFIQRAGAIYFGDSASLVFPLTALEKPESPQVQNLVSRITVAPSESRTSFISALNLGKQLFSQAEDIGPDRNKALVVFTDGFPDEPSGLSQEQAFSVLRDIYEREYKPAGIEVFIVGIDNQQNPIFSPTVSKWKGIVGDENVIKIENMDDLLGHFFQISRILFDIPLQDELVVDSTMGAGRGEFEVKPYMQSLEFHIFPETAELKFVINRPDGSPVDPRSDDVEFVDLGDYQQFIFQDPPPGVWSFQITEGAGKIVVYPNEIPVTLGLVEPGAEYPLGKELFVKAKLIRNDGREIKEYAEAPIRITAVIEFPSGKKTDVVLGPLSGGYAFAETAVRIDEEGDYAITLSASGGQEMRFTQRFSFSAHNIPYIEIIKPAHGSTLSLRKGLDVEARLMQGGEAVEPDKVFKGSPNELVLGSILVQKNKEKKVFWMNYAGPGSEGLYAAHVDIDLGIASDVLLTVQLQGEGVSGEHRQPQQAQVIFHVRSSGLQALRRALFWLMVALLGLISLCILAVLAFYVTRRPLRGKLSVSLQRSDGHLEQLAERELRGRLMWIKAEAGEDEGGDVEALTHRKHKPSALTIILWGSEEGGNECLGALIRFGDFRKVVHTVLAEGQFYGNKQVSTTSGTLYLEWQVL